MASGYDVEADLGRARSGGRYYPEGAGYDDAARGAGWLTFATIMLALVRHVQRHRRDRRRLEVQVLHAERGLRLQRPEDMGLDRAPPRRTRAAGGRVRSSAAARSPAGSASSRRA